MIRTPLLCAVLAGLALNAASSAPGPVAHYTFDEGSGDTVRDLSGNGNDGKVHGARWVASPRGHALQFDGKSAYVDCGANPLLNISGDMTLSAWLRLAPDAGGDKYIFGDNAGLAVQRNFYVSAYHKRLRMEHGNGQAVEQLVSDKEVFDGTWQHIALVCEFPRYYMFVNGQQIQTGEMSMPIVPLEMTARRIGGWFWEGGFFKGEIDEIRVYNRSVTDREIAGEAGLPPGAAPVGFQALQPVLHYPLQTLEIRAQCRNVSVAGASVDFAVTLPGGEVRRKSAPLKLTRPDSGRGLTAVSLSTRDFRPGECVVQATLKGPDGKTLANSEQQKVLYPQRPEWFASNAGKSDQAIAPYAPLPPLKPSRGAAPLTVTAGNQTHHFGSQPFPTAISTRTATSSTPQPLLAAPIRVVGTLDGKPVSFPALPTVKRSTPAQAQLAQEASGGALQSSLQTTLDYDGFLRFDWSLRAVRTATLDRLVVEIPLRPEIAKYFYAYPQGGALNADRALRFNPMLWIGDDEKGLSYVAESDEFWAPEAPEKALEVVRGGRETVLRLNLVAKPMTLAAGAVRSYSFGLEATPLRPTTVVANGQSSRPPDYWDFRFHHISQTTHGTADMILKVPDATLDSLQAGGVKTIAFHEHWTPYQGYSKTPFEADLKSFVDRCHARGIKVLLYFGFNISDLMPEWPYIGEDCVVRPKSGYVPYNYPPQPIQNAYIVCQKSVYQDLVVDGTARLIEKFGIDGVYLDSTTIAWGCSNSSHGCGYARPDGTRAPTYPVFAVRETLKRLYTAIKQRKPEGLVDVHVYDAMHAPALAFVTSYWTGEQLSPQPFLTDSISLERYRAEMMGVNWGVPAQFLHYRSGGSVRNCLALTLLHDIEIRAAGLTPDFALLSSVWKAMESFGRKEATWRPYFSNKEFVQVGPAECYASLYQHPRNSVLLVVSNLSRARAEVAVKLETAKLGLKGTLTAQDALTGATVTLQDSTVTTSLDSLGWQLIVVKGNNQ